MTHQMFCVCNQLTACNKYSAFMEYSPHMTLHYEHVPECTCAHMVFI